MVSSAARNTARCWTGSKHYQLRDINSVPRRELTLVDLNTGTNDGIRYGGPSLT
jgi:hypothetical protein